MSEEEQQPSELRNVYEWVRNLVRKALPDVPVYSSGASFQGCPMCGLPYASIESRVGERIMAVCIQGHRFDPFMRGEGDHE